MNADIINLRRARKARSRSEKEKTASQNRARFGMTRTERERLREEEARAVRHFEGLHLERPHENPSGNSEGAGDSET